MGLIIRHFMWFISKA